MATDLLTALRAYLVAQGVVRDPSVAGPLPPMWLAPALGVPAPGETPPRGSATEAGPDVVLGAYWTGGFDIGPYESSWRLPTVDLKMRVRKDSMSRVIEAAITPLLIDKREWMMSTLQVIDCELFRALQPLTLNEQAFDYVVSYRFMLYGP